MGMPTESATDYDLLLQRLHAQFAEPFDELVNRWLERAYADTKSPIEAQFLAALGGLFTLYSEPYSQARDMANALALSKSREWLTVVLPQAKIEAYTVDFLILCKGWGKAIDIIVECDGHEFHERTKKQAANDKSRDRRLQMLGYKVLRFTGSEIYKSAWNCALEVFEFADNLKGPPWHIPRGARAVPST